MGRCRGGLGLMGEEKGGGGLGRWSVCNMQDVQDVYLLNTAAVKEVYVVVSPGRAASAK